jgi:transcriptional regulator with XRE-family HTH domain
MSHIGTNIRKIRGVKNLNQSAFAELFNLKRPSVGAYEEGRAEPKISTIIDIAKHFGISIDDLLTKELSVNDLYRFDIFREDLLNDSKNNLTPSIPSVALIPVPFVSNNLLPDYLKSSDKSKAIDSLDPLYLPLAKGAHYCAFEISDNSMLANQSGFSAGDILIGEKPNHFNIDNLESNRTYLFETSTNLWVRTLVHATEHDFVLKPNNPSLYQHPIQKKDIQDVWQIKALFTKNISSPTDSDERLQLLQDQIQSIQQQIKTN